MQLHINKEHRSYLENNPHLVSLARFPHGVSPSPCTTSSVALQYALHRTVL